MINYNLTFNEAIAAGAAGKKISNDYKKDRIFKYYENQWIYFYETTKEWNYADFFENDIKAKWRIVTKQEDTVEETKDARLLEIAIKEIDNLKQEIKIIKEKSDDDMQFILNNYLRSFAEGLDAHGERFDYIKNHIEELYECKNNDEEIFKLYDKKLKALEKSIEERIKNLEENNLHQSYGGTD